MSEPSDCTPCRIISGFGCIGIGLYVGYMGSKSSKNPYSRLIIALISFGCAGVGVARLFGLPPFAKKKRRRMIDSSESTT